MVNYTAYLHGCRKSYRIFLRRRLPRRKGVGGEMDFKKCIRSSYP
jgi:hypothetical protein